MDLKSAGAASRCYLCLTPNRTNVYLKCRGDSYQSMSHAGVNTHLAQKKIEHIVLVTAGCPFGHTI